MILQQLCSNLAVKYISRCLHYNTLITRAIIVSLLLRLRNVLHTSTISPINFYRAVLNLALQQFSQWGYPSFLWLTTLNQIHGTKPFKCNKKYQRNLKKRRSVIFIVLSSLKHKMWKLFWKHSTKPNNRDYIVIK